MAAGLFCSSLPQLDPSQLSSGRSRGGRAGTCGSFRQVTTASANGWMRGLMSCMQNSDGSLRISPPSRAPRYGRAASPRRGRRCRCCRCLLVLWVKSPDHRGAVPTILCSRSAHLAGPRAAETRFRGQAEQAPPSHLLARPCVPVWIGWLPDRPARHLRHDRLWRKSIARTRLDLVHDTAHDGSHIRRPIPTFQRPRFLSMALPDFAL